MKILRIWRKACRAVVCSGHRQWYAKAIPVAVLTQYQVKEFYRQQFVAGLRDHIHRLRFAQGNLMAEAFYEQGDPSILWTMERWADDDSRNRNSELGASSLAIALAQEGLALPAEEIFIRDLEILTASAGSAEPAIDGESITVMLFITVKKGTAARFRHINHTVVEAFRPNPDVLSFIVSEVVRQRTRFVVYKKFRNREAFQAHLKEPVVQPVLQFLQTSVEEPPFEKGYHHLVELR